MTTENILRSVPCGACGLPLGKHLNVVGTGRRAHWKFPSMGNVLTGTQGEAVAFLCDSCVDDQAPPLEAIEFVGEGEETTVKHHELRSLAPASL